MVFSLIFFYLEIREESKMRDIEFTGTPITSKSPPCLQVYYSIEKYSEKYRIPRNYAYGIIWKETRYSGPLQWSYDPEIESHSGALGPMQIVYSTASSIWPQRKISRKELKENVDLNIETGMMFLRTLYDKYGDWKLAFGAYNTGSPVVNQYAVDVFNFKSF